MEGVIVHQTVLRSTDAAKHVGCAAGLQSVLAQKGDDDEGNTQLRRLVIIFTSVRMVVLKGQLFRV